MNLIDMISEKASQNQNRDDSSKDLITIYESMPKTDKLTLDLVILKITDSLTMESIIALSKEPKEEVTF